VEEFKREAQEKTGGRRVSKGVPNEPPSAHSAKFIRRLGGSTIRGAQRVSSASGGKYLLPRLERKRLETSIREGDSLREKDNSGKSGEKIRSHRGHLSKKLNGTQKEEDAGKFVVGTTRVTAP